MPSFKLVGRLKATEQIIAEEYRWKSWKVWLSLACEVLFVQGLAGAGLIHFSLYLAAIGIMTVMAWHRAGLLTTPWCHVKHDFNRLKRVSLSLFFPEDYSAFGLAQNQQPAVAFVRLSCLLRLLWFLAPFAFMYVQQTLVVAQSQEPSRSLQEKSLQDKVLGDYEPSTLLQGILLAALVPLACSTVLSWPTWLIMRWCCVGDLSGAKAADTELQQRVASRAKELSAQMKKQEFQPSFKELAMLYVDMGCYLLDWCTDVNCALQYFQSELYLFGSLQVLVICVALLCQCSVVMNTEEICCSGLWRAMSESIRYGYPTDAYLAMSLREKSVEAPLSFMLQSYIAISTIRRVLTPGSVTAGEQDTPEYTLSTQVTELSNFVSLCLSMNGMIKAAYVNYHLDLAYHIEVQEGDRKKLKAPATSPSPAGPTTDPKQMVPIQVGMPHGPRDTE